MAVVERVLSTTPERVWDVLADGWLYPLWVVGASRMREVDDDWPAADAALHHSVGAWPLLVDDETRVVESVPAHSLTLAARGWPLGEARVALRLSAHGAGTLVRLEEHAVSGPGSLPPRALTDPPIVWRNTETLRRLAYLAERRP